jgi:hypothetical protein
VKSSMITVLQWDSFQNIEQQSEQQSNSNRAASEHFTRTEEDQEVQRELLAVELPRGFPRDEDEAKAHAAFVGCPEAFAATTWALARGRGGRDSKDVPIRSWRHFLKSQWEFERVRLEVKAQRAPSAQRKASVRPNPEHNFHGT